MSANCLNRLPLPSITGLPASAPMLPSPSTAVPLVTTATRLPLAVYRYASSGFFADLQARLGDAGRVGERQVALVVQRLGRDYGDFAWAAGAMVVESVFAFHQSGVRSHRPPGRRHPRNRFARWRVLLRTPSINACLAPPVAVGRWGGRGGWHSRPPCSPRPGWCSLLSPKSEASGRPRTSKPRARPSISHTTRRAAPPVRSSRSTPLRRSPGTRFPTHEPSPRFRTPTARSPRAAASAASHAPRTTRVADSGLIPARPQPRRSRQHDSRYRCATSHGCARSPFRRAPRSLNNRHVHKRTRFR